MKIGLVGDIALSGLICDDYENNITRYKEISSILNELDFVFANLETPINNNYKPNVLKKRVIFSSYSVTKNLLEKFNVKCVSLANNHIFDLGMDGLRETINLLEKMGIKYTGAGWENKHIEPAFIDIGCETFAFISYVHKSTNPKTEMFDDLLINNYCLKKIINEINFLKQKVHKIIVSIHWGNDYSFYPTQEQFIDSHKIIDAGASLIMGHHPHTIQPFENYNNSSVFYSLGGLTFGDFFWNGELRALKKKTKRSFLPILNENLEITSLVALKELKGNKVQVETRNYFIWSKRKLFYAKLIHRFILIRIFFHIKETFFDRVSEFLFGYYRSPFDLFKLKNIKKIKFIVRDLKIINK